jgi:hypothetical protein
MSYSYRDDAPAANLYPAMPVRVNSGLGSWSQAELVQYLRTGDVRGKAQAAGSMG